MSKKPIPFDFVLDELEPLSPRTKPMFGAYGVYVGDQIVFILYQKDKNPADCGVWLATTGEHHASLQREFSSLRSIEIFGPGPTGWQVLPAESDDFEEAVLKACRLVLHRDPRIGKTPKGRKIPSKPRKVGKWRASLVQKLNRIPGLEDRPSKVAGGSAIFYRGKEIAHFHDDHEIDVRLTRKIIRQQGLAHPSDSKIHQHRSPSSDWIEIRFHKAADVAEVVRLFKLALKQY